MDERFRKVALVLKSWNRGTEASKNNRLNSFSIYLLLLAFMLEFKYMINLQKEAPSEETFEVKVHTDQQTMTKITTEVQFLKDMAEIEQVCEQRHLEGNLKNQRETPADVLVNFLRFYLYHF